MSIDREGPMRHPRDLPITAERVEEHGLTAEEYEKIVGILGREPSYTELGVFSALWSEHCGYKNSRPLLREFPTEAPWVLQGPGENAGDRKSTRLNSSHVAISYAVFCLKKKKRYR